MEPREHALVHPAGANSQLGRDACGKRSGCSYEPRRFFDRIVDAAVPINAAVTGGAP